MSNLIRSPNLRDPDGFYASLVTAHQGLSTRQRAMNARLVLILANHIGDPAVLAEALALARGQLAGRPTDECVFGKGTSTKIASRDGAAMAASPCSCRCAACAATGSADQVGRCLCGRCTDTLGLDPGRGHGPEVGQLS